MAKKLFCAAGAVALSIATLVGLLFGSSSLVRLFTWLYEVGFLDWIFGGNEALLGVAPIWVFWLSIVVTLLVGLPTYHRCRSYWSRRADSQG